MRFSGLLALAAAVISGSLAQSDPAGERRCAGGGVCVPFYLCENGLVIEDGEGLIDKRFADSDYPEDFVCCQERESECRGQCVPFYQCSNAGGKDLLNLRSFDDKCPGDLVCCNEPPVKPTPCTCVAFYQCLDDVVNTGGKDLIDLRQEKCPGDEVCCVNPRPQDNTIVVESSCKGKCVPYALCPNKTVLLALTCELSMIAQTIKCVVNHCRIPALKYQKFAMESASRSTNAQGEFRIPGDNT